jgi:hypothetical protein
MALAAALNSTQRIEEKPKYPGARDEAECPSLKCVLMSSQ